LPIFLAFLLYFLIFPVVDFLKNKMYVSKFLGSALVWSRLKVSNINDTIKEAAAQQCI
jgi:hypothetical protein